MASLLSEDTRAFGHGSLPGFGPQPLARQLPGDALPAGTSPPDLLHVERGHNLGIGLGSGAPLVIKGLPPPVGGVSLSRGQTCPPPQELSSTAVSGRVRRRGLPAFAEETSESRGRPPRIPVLRASQVPPAPPGGHARTWEVAEAGGSLMLSTQLAAEEGGWVSQDWDSGQGWRAVGGRDSRPRQGRGLGRHWTEMKPVGLPGTGPRSAWGRVSSRGLEAHTGSPTCHV